MNWDEKAKWEAMGRFFSTPIPTAQETRMPMPFIWGAEWQRDQLRTNEAIERAAKTIHETTQFPGPQPSWEELKKTNPDYCTYRRDLVEETIHALLGDTP